ncbi:MAG TPA: PadR family transcriptional regulator [Longimicrobiales bacterium]|nr:PadR family transcriptional regulator [Longimicrobiales bacterium]
MANPVEFLRGTMELLILRSLVWGPAHGFAIARWIERATEDSLEIEEGTLYPALHRMEARGLIEAEWGISENGRRAKFYVLTEEGRAQLRAQTKSWRRYVRAVSLALEAPR